MAEIDSRYWWILPLEVEAAKAAGMDSTIVVRNGNAPLSKLDQEEHRITKSFIELGIVWYMYDWAQAQLRDIFTASHASHLETQELHSQALKRQQLSLVSSLAPRTAMMDARNEHKSKLREPFHRVYQSGSTEECIEVIHVTNLVMAAIWS